MRRHTIPAAAAVAAALLLTACGGTDDLTDGTAADEPVGGDTESDGAEEPGDEQLGDPGPEPEPGDASASDPLLGPELELAIDDVLERTGASRDDVQILATELVDWADGSIGCPEPDMMYTQAIVDGFRIVLEVDGETYDYHGASGADPAYCADPEPPIS